MSFYFASLFYLSRNVRLSRQEFFARKYRGQLKIIIILLGELRGDLPVKKWSINSSEMRLLSGLCISCTSLVMSKSCFLHSKLMGKRQKNYKFFDRMTFFEKLRHFLNFHLHNLELSHSLAGNLDVWKKFHANFDLEYKIYSSRKF